MGVSLPHAKLFFFPFAVKCENLKKIKTKKALSVEGNRTSHKACKAVGDLVNLISERGHMHDIRNSKTQIH